MEEDKKYLEKMIKEYKKFGDLDNPEFEDTDKIYQAIENLIKRNKELEKQKSYDIAYKQGKAFENHRWKSLVKEKIEELENEKEQLRIEKNVILDTGIYKIDLKITAYKELLGDDK